MSSSKNLEFEKTAFLSKSNSTFIEEMYLKFVNKDPSLPDSWREYFSEIGDQAEVAKVVTEIASDDAYIIYGLVYDKSLGEDLKVTIVATGVDQKAPSVVVDNEPSIRLNPVGLDKDKTSQKVGTSSAEAIDFLDVPTFMRKQVD